MENNLFFFYVSHKSLKLKLFAIISVKYSKQIFLLKQQCHKKKGGQQLKFKCLHRVVVFVKSFNSLQAYWSLPKRFKNTRK